MNRIIYLLIVLLLTSLTSYAKQPNVIFISLDDLNDWVHCYGFEQVITPNIDRLAKSGVKFTNAHTPGVYCAPSRTAIFTGQYASTTGCYGNQPLLYNHLAIETLQISFQESGYTTFGAGKLYHHMPGHIDLRAWTEFFARSQEVKDVGWRMSSNFGSDVPLPNPYPYSPYYTKTSNKFRPNLEWGPIDNRKEEEMVDVIRTNWVCDILKRNHSKPFFLALGLYAPHFPTYAPQKYFDMYNLNDIKLPESKEDDWDDLPASVQSG